MLRWNLEPATQREDGGQQLLRDDTSAWRKICENLHCKITVKPLYIYNAFHCKFTMRFFILQCVYNAFTLFIRFYTVKFTM